LASRLKAPWGAAVRIVGIDILNARFVAKSLLCDGGHTVPTANTAAYYDRVKEVVAEDLLGDFMVQDICDGPVVTVDGFHEADTGHGFAVCRERFEPKAGVCRKRPPRPNVIVRPAGEKKRRRGVPAPRLMSR